MTDDTAIPQAIVEFSVDAYLRSLSAILGPRATHS